MKSRLLWPKPSGTRIKVPDREAEEGTMTELQGYIIIGELLLLNFMVFIYPIVFKR